MTGEGWSYAAVADPAPTRIQLDLVVPDRPAWLVSYDGHTGWANSIALRAAGVTSETQDPSGGTIVRDASGQPTGVLKESAQELVERLLPKPPPYEKERAFARALAQAAAWGLTGVQQAGITEEDLALLARVLERTPLLQVYAALPIERDPTSEALARQDAVRRRYASGRLRVGAVKGFVDGVVEAALRHFTRDAAWAEHAEAEKGTLSPGRRADFVVLSQDLLAVAPGQIQAARVLLTVLGGQDSFRAQEF